jgi:hypothetical protein
MNKTLLMLLFVAIAGFVIVGVSAKRSGKDHDAQTKNNALGWGILLSIPLVAAFGPIGLIPAAAGTIYALV